MTGWLTAHAPLAGAPVLVYLLVALIDTHITTACVTLYLHRCQTHLSIAFHPVVAHFMRAWLWLRTAMPTREWVAVHRCHHAHVDTAEDPHSPIVYGIWRVVLLGTQLYHTAAHNEAICRQYGRGTPDDWVERHLYQPLSLVGPTVTLVTNVLIFGAAGVAMWLVEMQLRDARSFQESARQRLGDRHVWRKPSQQPPSRAERGDIFCEARRDRSRLFVLPVLQVRGPRIATLV